MTELDLDDLERQAQGLRNTGRDRFDVKGAAAIALRALAEVRSLRSSLVMCQEALAGSSRLLKEATERADEAERGLAMTDAELTGTRSRAERAEAERDAARADSSRNAAGLLYWNRRYVETERQAAMDVAARDEARAQLAAVRKAVSSFLAVADEIATTDDGNGYFNITYADYSRYTIAEEALTAALAAVPQGQGQPQSEGSRWGGIVGGKPVGTGAPPPEPGARACWCGGDDSCSICSPVTPQEEQQR